MEGKCFTIIESGFSYDFSESLSANFCFRGKLVQELCLPAKLTTSVAFGGKNLDELYVTSKADDSEDGGYLFRITGSGLRGLPMSNCKF